MIFTAQLKSSRANPESERAAEQQTCAASGQQSPELLAPTKQSSTSQSAVTFPRGGFCFTLRSLKSPAFRAHRYVSIAILFQLLFAASKTGSLT
jgi:hypothetical protein